MKSIHLTFRVSHAQIPLNYHHEVQSMIYTTLKEIGGSGEKWHDHERMPGTNYKYFTFSSLRGNRRKSERKNNQLHFISRVYLDIRSADESLSNDLILAFSKKKQYKLFNQSLILDGLSWENPQISSDILRIQMLSPLTIHRKQDDRYTDFSSPFDTEFSCTGRTMKKFKKTYYYSPFDAEFSDKLNNNFIDKYTAFTGNLPDGNIRIVPQKIKPADKYVTHYRKIDAETKEEIEIIINAWRGIYILSGKPEHLNFLYYCGLGARNSAGFGMFEVIK